MARDRSEHLERGASGISAEISELGIRGRHGIWNVDGVAIHAVQVGYVLYRVNLLSIVLFALLRLGDSTRMRGPRSKFCCKQCVVLSHLYQHMKAGVIHGVEGDAFGGFEPPQKLQRLRASQSEVLPGEM